MNGSCDVVSSERESMNSSRSAGVVGLVPNILSFVLIKKSLSLSGSALRGFLLGWRIRCVIFHTSFGLLEERAVLIKFRFVLLITDFILLRTSRKAFQESSLLVL